MSKHLLTFVTLCAMILNCSMPDAAAQNVQRRAAQVDLLVLGGTIVTMNKSRDVIENGGVAVKGGRIVAVGTAGDLRKKYAARQTINAAGRMVVPGLINGHTHVPMVLFRGLADDLDLQ